MGLRPVTIIRLKGTFWHYKSFSTNSVRCGTEGTPKRVSPAGACGRTATHPLTKHPLYCGGVWGVKRGHGRVGSIWISNRSTSTWHPVELEMRQTAQAIEA